jgi:hypothetical protein
MFDAFGEKIEKLRERIAGPREIMFEKGKKLIVSIVGEEAQIKLMDGENEILDLRSLAPEGTKFVFSPKDKWGAEAGNKILYFGRFKGADCLLSFLHELGHLEDELGEKLINQAKREYWREKKSDTNHAYPIQMQVAIYEEMKEVMRSERSAWAFALRKARELERRYDIVIFKQIGKTEDVVNFVNGFLKTYEDGYVSELYDLDIYTKEGMMEFFSNLEKKLDNGQKEDAVESTEPPYWFDPQI